jgi:hypothetical protein
MACIPHGREDREKMRLIGRWLCLAGWLVALAMSIYVEAEFPGRIAVLGAINVPSHDSVGKFVYQFVWIVSGLVFVGSGFIFERLRVVGPLLSASLYLIWRFGTEWFPYGLGNELGWKWAISFAFDHEFIFFVLDILLPIGFMVTLVLTISEMRSKKKIP